LRFVLRYFVYLKPQFDAFRQESGKPGADDIECFCSLLSQRLSAPANRLVDQARERHSRYNKLFDTILKKALRGAEKKDARTVEGSILKALVDFELVSARKEKNWSFRYGGLTRLTDDFSLLLEFLENSSSKQFRGVCKRWGDFILTETEKSKLAGLTESERAEEQFQFAREHMLAPWALFVAMCHCLQTDEHILTPRDAFWLGLIDEVIGEADLPCLRTMFEIKPDPGTEAPGGQKPG
jgi:hypothetical protein